MAQYRITTPCFIAPDLIDQKMIDKYGGVIIKYDGAPSVTWEPLDEEAEAAIEKLMASNPNAGLNPVFSLRTNGGAPGDIEPPAVVEFLPQEEVRQDVGLTGTIAMPGRAKPGLTEGGKALNLK